MDKICKHLFVSGRVQGVWYRGFVKKNALAHGLTGWATNLSNGQVEVLLCGQTEAVNAVIVAMYDGPPLALVNHIDEEVLDWRDVEGFTTS